MRAAIYSRVSTKAQAEKEASIPDQIEKCSALARELGATEIDASFVDDGYSGADPHRPAMQRLLAAVRDAAFDLVVCYDVDRWARDLADQLAFADEVSKYARLEFVTTKFGANAEDRLFFQIRGSFAEYERAKIRVRTTMGERRKVEVKKKLLYPGQPYGYRYNGDRDNPQLVPYEPEAEVVRKIFHWVAVEGFGAYVIADRLGNDPKHRTPPPRGTTWHPGTVRRIIRSET